MSLKLLSETINVRLYPHLKTETKAKTKKKFLNLLRIFKFFKKKRWLRVNYRIFKLTKEIFRDQKFSHISITSTQTHIKGNTPLKLVKVAIQNDEEELTSSHDDRNQQQQSQNDSIMSRRRRVESVLREAVLSRKRKSSQFRRGSNLDNRNRLIFEDVASDDDTSHRHNDVNYNPRVTPSSSKLTNGNYRDTSNTLRKAIFIFIFLIK